MVRNTVIPKQPGSQYTNDQRKAVIASYVETGNISQTAKIHSLPRTTVTGWVKSDWGKEMAVKIRHSDEQASATNLTKLNGNTIGTGSLVEQGSKYTDEQRREAVVEYGIHGNMTKVAEVTGIPDSTLSHWKQHSDWWDTLLGELRNEISDRILPQYLEIVEKANERQIDSLENGDEKLIWDKAKKKHVVKLVKPTGKDASFMGGLAQDKARVLMSLPTAISSNQGSEEAIRDLCKLFEDISDEHHARQLKEKDAIPGEYKKIEEDQDK